MNEDDCDWIKSAISDDSVVVELLIRLRSESVTNLKQQQPRLLEWGIRQPRSRQIVRYDVVHPRNQQHGKKKGELTRASPTTPLSWSAGTSNSGGGGVGDGYEESSLWLNNARSKVNSTSEINAKRSRKKKTFAELKEQEVFLLKEGVHLKRALTSERMLYEKEKVRNESLKRLKLDMQIATKSTTSFDTSKKQIFNLSYQFDAGPIDRVPPVWLANGKCNELDHVLHHSPPVADSVHKKDLVALERLPVLPDLNLLPDLNMPLEEDLS
ncbi:hypothetical protein FRX31_030376 [Thalictrum thalictroides]|uniref:Uncharacterized protein n=1 Tax=Thalictrum thalictroides TaxID=46969 RepID=A0A7J6V6J1_THATH|nr:hypothetical protein FRX31_030376 [Thalictrum thalictroides]